MIRLKSGVTIRTLKPEIYRIFGILDETFAYRDLDCWITSANDSKHMAGSKHYQDLAIDIRSQHLPSLTEKRRVLSELRQSCGNEYDILLENVGKPSEHFHIESDPEED